MQPAMRAEITLHAGRVAQSRMSSHWCHLWLYLSELPAGLTTLQTDPRLLQATVLSLTCCEYHQSFIVLHVCSLVPLVALPFGAARRTHSLAD